jgi:hypothetical protein
MDSQDRLAPDTRRRRVMPARCAARQLKFILTDTPYTAGIPVKRMRVSKYVVMLVM